MKISFEGTLEELIVFADRLRPKKLKGSRTFVAVGLYGGAPTKIVVSAQIIKFIKEYVANGQRIEAIKHLRNEYSIGLKEAKDIVEEIAKT